MTPWVNPAILWSVIQEGWEQRCCAYLSTCRQYWVFCLRQEISTRYLPPLRHGQHRRQLPKREERRTHSFQQRQSQWFHHRLEAGRRVASARTIRCDYPVSSTQWRIDRRSTQSNGHRVSEDFSTWRGKVKRGGIFAFHDYRGEGWEMVTDFIDTVVIPDPHWTRLGQVGSVIAFRRDK